MIFRSLENYPVYFILCFHRSHGITRVVNCTHGESKIPDYHKDKLEYFTFPVSNIDKFRYFCAFPIWF